MSMFPAAQTWFPPRTFPRTTEHRLEASCCPRLPDWHCAEAPSAALLPVPAETAASWEARPEEPTVHASGKSSTMSNHYFLPVYSISYRLFCCRWRWRKRHPIPPSGTVLLSQTKGRVPHPFFMGHRSWSLTMVPSPSSRNVKASLLIKPPPVPGTMSFPAL